MLLFVFDFYIVVVCIWLLLIICGSIFLSKKKNQKKFLSHYVRQKEKKTNLLDRMDSNQLRPVTPQPPQEGGSGGFSAILTVFLSFIAIFTMILNILNYQLLTQYINIPPPPLCSSLHPHQSSIHHILSLIDFNSVCFSIWSLTLSVSSYSRLDF